MASMARGDPLPCLCNIFLVVILLAMQVTAQSVHTVFPTECGRYFIWQTMGEFAERSTLAWTKKRYLSREFHPFDTLALLQA